MYKNKDNLNFRNVNEKIGMYKDIIDLLMTVFEEYLWKSLRDLLWDFYIDYKGSLIYAVCCLKHRVKALFQWCWTFPTLQHFAAVGAN